MKKKNRRAASKSEKPKKKKRTIMRHSREGVKTKGKAAGKRAGKAKAKARTTPKPNRTAGARTSSRPGAKAARKKKTPGPSRSSGERPDRTRSRRFRARAGESPSWARGLGGESAGQSGDTEGLSRAEETDSESVEELVEEGQAFEAGVISGVEEGRNRGPRGVRTREVPEDDVPQEYLDED